MPETTTRISPPRCSPFTDANRLRLSELSRRASAQNWEPVLAADVRTIGDKAISITYPRNITKGKHRCGGQPSKPVYSDRGEQWESLPEAARAIGVANSSVVRHAADLGYKCKGRRLAYEPFGVEVVG